MKLKKIRQQKNLSQSKLSKLSGVSQSAICYIENGAKSPGIVTIQKLAKALGIPVMQLLGSEEPSQKETM